jgi:hypothetical protein
MGMAVQPLYGDRALGLAGDWAGRDERNFGAITSPTMCRTAVAQLFFTVTNQISVPVPNRPNLSAATIFYVLKIN